MKFGIPRKFIFIFPAIFLILFSSAFSLPVLITQAQQNKVHQKFDLKSLSISRHAGEEYSEGDRYGKKNGRGPASLRMQDLQIMPSIPSAPVISGKRNTYMMVTCMDRVGRAYTPDEARYQDCLEGSGFSQGRSIFNQSGSKNLQMGIIFQ